MLCDEGAAIGRMFESLPGTTYPCSTTVCVAIAGQHITLHRQKVLEAFPKTIPCLMEATPRAPLRGPHALFIGIASEHSRPRTTSQNEFEPTYR
jgi:hypothetical protein